MRFAHGVVKSKSFSRSKTLYNVALGFFVSANGLVVRLAVVRLAVVRLTARLAVRLAMRLAVRLSVRENQCRI